MCCFVLYAGLSGPHGLADIGFVAFCTFYGVYYSLIIIGEWSLIFGDYDIYFA